MNDAVRRFLLIPSARQWRRWTMPNRQGAAGLWVGVVALMLTVYALIPSSDSIKNDARTRIEAVVSIRAAEIKALSEIDHGFVPLADFATQTGVMSELERFSDYGFKLNQTLDLAEIDRLFMTYGNSRQRAELAARINRVHDATRAVTHYLIVRAQSDGPKSQDEAHRWTQEYLNLLNADAASQAELRGFIAGLTPRYFGY